MSNNCTSGTDLRKRSHLRRRDLLRAAVAMPFLAVAHAQVVPQGLRFNAVREGERIVVRASALLRSDLTTVWSTLVDYARLAEFIPGMEASELLGRRGDQLLVRQVGRARFGPISRQFSVTLEVRETPLREVTARAVAGDFEHFESGYQLAVDVGGGTRLDYRATMWPAGGLPPLVGEPLMRDLMREQFKALLTEAERRATWV